MSQPPNLNLGEGFDARELQVYEAVGEEIFRKLVDVFYERVSADPALAHMFPPDLTEAKEHQLLFLQQFFGGPKTYLERFGHPRLRMRHLPFVIGMKERDAWLGHMVASIDEVGVSEPWSGVMKRYFERSSLAMMNSGDENGR